MLWEIRIILPLFRVLLTSQLMGMAIGLWLRKGSLVLVSMGMETK